MGVSMVASQISMSRHGNKSCCNSAIQCPICPRLHRFDKNPGLNTSKYEYSIIIRAPPAGNRKLLLQIKSNQIKSLLLSHHHSTSALVSEILMSVLQTVQKNNRQFTYGQTVQKNNNSNLHMDRQCKKNNSNLHMDSTYLQTVQKTMCKIHIHALSTLSVL